jgi:hypothetical protein
VPLNLGHYPPKPAPILGLVVKVNDLDLNATLGRSAHRATEVRRYQLIQVLIGWQPDELCEALFLAILVDLRFGKGGVPPKPDKPEPGPVALHHGLDELQGAIGGMDVTRSQPSPRTVAFVDKANPRTKTILGRMAIIGNRFLCPWAGSSVESGSIISRFLFLLLVRVSVDRVRVGLRGLQTSLVAQNVILPQPRT